MKRLHLVAVLFFFIVGSSAISWGGESLPLQGSIGVGARVYGVFPKGDSFLGQDLDFDNEVGGEVNVTYRFLKYLALEVGVGYTEIDAEIGDLGIDWATIDALPIYATLQFRWVSRKPEELKWIVPYAAIGGGYYVLDIEERTEYRHYWRSMGAGVDLDIDDAFFVHVGGGFDIFLTEHIVLNLEGRYSWSKIDVDETQVVGSTVLILGDSFDLDAVFIGGGFKFFF